MARLAISVAFVTATALCLAFAPSAAADPACVGHWEANDCDGVSGGNFSEAHPESDPICEGVFVNDFCVGIAEAETGDWTCYGAYSDGGACHGLQNMQGRLCIEGFCF